MRSNISAWYRYTFCEWRNRWLDKTAMFIAWHLLPRRVRMWTIVRATADAAGHDKHPDQVRYKDMYETCKV